MQNLFHCLSFWSFFVSETVFVRFAMGFNRFFSLFCQILAGSGGFLSWFLRKRNTNTFMRNTAIERVIKLFCVCANLIVKVSWMLLVSKITNVVKEDDIEKRKEILRLLLHHKMNFGYRMLIYFRQSWFCKGLF